jgi:preprotein translocase subunit SecG
MEIFKTALIVLHFVVTTILIVVVLLQESKSGASSAIVGGSDTDTFFGKNSGGTKEAILKRWTAVCACLFLVTSFVLALIMK